jgi:hypothetical protein
MVGRCFPSPWTVGETDVRFIVKNHNEQALGYVYLRGRTRPADCGQLAYPRRGAADRGEYRHVTACSEEASVTKGFVGPCKVIAEFAKFASAGPSCG